MLVREFNKEGINSLKDLLLEVKEGKRTKLPEELLNSNTYSNIFEESIELKNRQFTSRAIMTLHLINKFKEVPHEKLHYNSGLWSWLSAFYFKSVCKRKKDGTRKVGALNRHILNVDHWGRYYRHLLACSYRLYDELGPLSKIYLSGNIYEFGEHLEQLAAQQKFVASKGVVEAATILYWNERKQKIKKNARDKNGPGIIRRYTTDILNQFDITFDINSMDGDEIIDLLPKEFDKWLTN